MDLLSPRHLLIVLLILVLVVVVRVLLTRRISNKGSRDPENP